MSFLNFFVLFMFPRGAIPFVGSCSGEAIDFLVCVLRKFGGVYVVGVVGVQMFPFWVPRCRPFRTVGRFVSIFHLTWGFLRVWGRNIMFVAVNIGVRVPNGFV